MASCHCAHVKSSSLVYVLFSHCLILYKDIIVTHLLRFIHVLEINC